MALPSIDMEFNVAGLSMTELATELVQFLEGANGVALAEWFSDHGEGDSAASFLQALPGLPPETDFLDFLLDDQARGSLQLTDGVWRLHASSEEAKDEATLRAWLQAASTFCRGWFARMPVSDMRISRRGGGQCCPHPPLVPPADHLIVTTHAAIAENYDLSQAFWGAGWEAADEEHGQVLLVRALTATTNGEYLAETWPHLWRLARGAKPRRTRYGLSFIGPDEQQVFDSGDALLMELGYDPAGQSMDYMAAAFGDDEHVRGWEVFMLREIVEAGALPSGEPVKTVRVSFLEQELAEREKRPLQDVGVEVAMRAAASADPVSAEEPLEVQPPSLRTRDFVATASDEPPRAESCGKRGTYHVRHGTTWKPVVEFFFDEDATKQANVDYTILAPRFGDAEARQLVVDCFFADMAEGRFGEHVSTLAFAPLGSVAERTVLAHPTPSTQA
ncbi:hypothetical protein OAX78_00285 [Planctomycetota bacterium]|nr:hypothetical protein [Planctomycetota bacterium]